MKRTIHGKYTELRRREALLGWGYLSVPLGGILLFYIIPFLITIGLTFTSGTGKRTFVGISNYIDVFGSEAFQLATANTFRFIAICVPSIVLLGLCLALLLGMKLRGSHFFRPVFILPLVLPVASVTMFFEIFFEKAGVINQLLATMNLETVDFMETPMAFWILVLLYLWKNTGYNVVLFLAGLSTIPKEFYEVAQVDGANARQQLMGITLPLLIPTFFFSVILSVINCFKAFREAFSLGGSYPHSSIYMLQHFMNNNFQNVNYSRLSVAALMTFIVIFLFVFILWRLQKKGEQ